MSDTEHFGCLKKEKLKKEINIPIRLTSTLIKVLKIQMNNI